MTTLFFRVMEFSIYGVFWLTLFFLVSSLIGKKTGVLWQYFVVVCIAVHLLVPLHIQWISFDFSFLHEISQSAFGAFDVQDKTGQNSVAAGNRGEQVPALEVENRSAEQKKETEKEQVSFQKAEKNIRTQQAGNNSAIQGNLSDAGEQVKGIRSGSGLAQRGRHGDIPYTIIAAVIWILGMLVCFGKDSLSYLAFRKQAKRWSLPAKPFADSILQEVKCQYGIERKMKLWRNSKVTSPMLYGVIRPVLLLPDKEYSEGEYRYIFQHELCHYRHADILMKHVFALCKIVYWFHPLVWWMCGRAYLQMEILCDEAVVGGADLEEKKAYSMVILRHMSGDAAFRKVPLATSFYGGKEDMKLRFKNIMDTRKKKAGFFTVLVAAVAVITLGGVKWSVTAGAEKNTSTEGKENPIQVSEEGTEQEIPCRRILVIGTDSFHMADAILLVNVDTESGKVTVESVPRELMVDFEKLDYSPDTVEIQRGAEKTEGLPELSKQKKMKLGSTLAYGYGLLVGAVEKMYQVEIDSHMVINYKAVRKVIDAAGGVEVTLTKQEAEYLNSTNYISKKENRNVKTGKQVLNGDQAMGYMRIRKVDNPIVNGAKSKEQGSFGRNQRCGNVVNAFVEQVQKNKVDWKEMLQSLVKGKKDTQINVNLSVKEMVSLIKKVAAGDLEVTVSEERTSEDYVAIQDSQIGSCLQPKE